jgi:hypothetical protein
MTVNIIVTGASLSFALLFFVINDNQKLKKRIDKGLIEVKKNGSFLRQFDNHLVTKNMLITVKLGQIKRFNLKIYFCLARLDRLLKKSSLQHSRVSAFYKNLPNENERIIDFYKVIAGVYLAFNNMTKIITKIEV